MVDRRQYRGMPIIAVYKTLIESELEGIEDYIRETSLDLKDKQDKLNENYRTAINAVHETPIEEGEEDDQYDVDTFFDNDMYRYFNVFPIYTFNPLLLVLYGQFENWLKKLCDLDRQKELNQIKVSDLAGSNYIDKSRRYLNLVADLALDGKDINWQRIVEIQKIRNCIAHNNSSIIKDKSKSVTQQELFLVLSKDTRIELDTITGKFYIKDNEFLLDFINIIKKYIFPIIDKLLLRKVVVKNSAMTSVDSQWGKDTSEELLKDFILTLNKLERTEGKNAEYYMDYLKLDFQNLSDRMTKIYAFFSGSEWDENDKELILLNREEGLKKLKSLYKS